MNKLFWFDCETTGLDPVKNDIIQLSYVIEIDGIVKEQEDLKMQPFSYENISQEALNIHGITLDEIKTFEDPKKVYRHLVSVFDKYVNKYDRSDKFTPGGYNIENFDIPFLKNFWLKNNDKYFGSYLRYKGIDPFQVIKFVNAIGKDKYDSMKLEAACKKFDIEIKAHDAMSDILATRELAYKMLDRYFK